MAIFKSRFFGSGWAHYETAKPGMLKLSPPAGREAELQRDYVKMEPMFLKSPLPFAEILKVLGDAQREINAESTGRTW